MRTTLIGLLSVLTLVGPPAFADRDDQLLESLQLIRENVSLLTEADRAARAGVEVPLVVLASTTALALATQIPGAPFRTLGINPGRLVMRAGEASIYALGLGALMWIAAKSYGFAAEASQAELPIDYTTAKGLRRFLALPIDQQFMLARQNPEFTKFIIEFGQNVVNIRHGFSPVYRSPKGLK